MEQITTVQSTDNRKSKDEISSIAVYVEPLRRLMVDLPVLKNCVANHGVHVLSRNNNAPDMMF